MQRGFAPIIVFFGIGVVFILFLIIMSLVPFGVNLPSEPKACTADAKVCPDGSSVGRSGPNCEFAACPSITPSVSAPADTANWKTYKGNNYSFQYPADWLLKPDTGYLETVSMQNPKKTVDLLISKGQYPYGFGAAQDVNNNNLDVVVDSIDYQAKELVTGGKKAYVDFRLDNPGDYHVLFGTGYPAGDDSNYSIQDYQASKPIILKILSTFKFN